MVRHAWMGILALGAAVAAEGVALAQPRGGSGTAAPAPVVKTTAFMTLEGINGESQNPNLTMELLGVRAPRDLATGAAVTAPRDAQTGQAAVRPLSAVTVTKRIDKSTPRLREVLSRGTHIPTVTIEVTSPVNGEYYQLTLRDVFLTSLTVSAAGSGEELPKESLTLNFTKIEVKYGKLDGQGGKGPSSPVPAGFDCTRVNKIE